MKSLHEDYLEAVALVNRVEAFFEKEEEAFLAHWHATHGGTVPQENLDAVNNAAVAHMQEVPSSKPDLMDVKNLADAHEALQIAHAELQTEHATTKEEHAQVIAAIEKERDDALAALKAKEQPPESAK